MDRNGDSIGLTSLYGMRNEGIPALMKHRVFEIFIVVSHSDAFVLEEDRQLTEPVVERSRNLDQSDVIPGATTGVNLLHE